MRHYRRQILRAQGRMVRTLDVSGHTRVLRSWHPTIVGDEANPSNPGSWQSINASVAKVPGSAKSRRRALITWRWSKRRFAAVAARQQEVAS